MGAASIEQGPAQGPAAQVEAHPQLECRTGVRRARPATAGPPQAQRVRQHDGRAVEEHHRREPLQQRDRHRLRRDHRLHRRRQHRLQKGCGRLAAALSAPLGADGAPRDRGRLRQRRARGVRVGQPAEHERLDKGRPRQLRAPLHEARGPRGGVRRGRDYSLQGLGQLWYGGHQEAPSVLQGRPHPYSAKGALLRVCYLDAYPGVELCPRYAST